MAATTLSGTVLIRIEASDDVGIARVTLTIGEDEVASFTAPPFEMSWDTTERLNGSVTLTVRAYDAADNVRSARVEVTVENEDTEAPVVTILAPLEGEQRSGVIDFIAEAEDNVNVHVVNFRLDGAAVLVPTGRHPWVATYDTEHRLRNGTHTIYATGLDAAFNEGRSPTVTFETWHSTPLTFINRPTSSGDIHLRFDDTQQEFLLAPGDTLRHVEPPEATTFTYTRWHAGPYGSPETRTINLEGIPTGGTWEF